MSRDMRTVIEASELARLFEGSLESKLQAISDAVHENKSFFGGKPHLFSTHDDHLVVFVEGRDIFVTCEYSMGDGVSFSKLEEANVDVLSEDTLLSTGVEQVASGGSLRSVLSALVSMPFVKQESIDDKMEKVFDANRPWFKYIKGGNRRSIEEFSFSDTEMVSIGRRYVGEEGSVEGVTITRSFSDLSSKLSEMNALSKESFDNYKEATGTGRSVEVEATLSVFDEVAADFLDTLDEVLDLVSVGVAKAKEGKSVAAKIHDKVAEQLGNLHLGSQFVTKMAEELKTV